MSATLYLRQGSRGAAVRIVQRLLHVYEDGIFGTLTAEAVCSFQRVNGMTADGIVGLKTWLLLAGTSLLPSSRPISEIIVHCTASPEGRDDTVADITHWHRQQGYSDIGYHYLITLDGTVHEGRPVDVAGAHCAGHNANSIGVAYVGGMTADMRAPKDTRTAAQRESLLKLLTDLRRLYPSARIIGHHELNSSKACPSFDVAALVRTLPVLLLCSLTVGCSSPREVVVEHIRHDTILASVEHRDSIRVVDSTAVIVHTLGDTVMREVTRLRTVFRDRVVLDTVRMAAEQTATEQRIYPAPTPSRLPKRTTRVLTLALFCGLVAAALYACRRVLP